MLGNRFSSMAFCRCSLTLEQPNRIWQMECSIPPAGSFFRSDGLRQVCRSGKPASSFPNARYYWNSPRFTRSFAGRGDREDGAPDGARALFRLWSGGFSGVAGFGRVGLPARLVCGWRPFLECRPHCRFDLQRGRIHAAGIIGWCVGQRNTGAAGNAGEIVRLYEDKGPACIAELNGWFSGVLLDLPARKLILFNDRYGLGRIYFHESPQGFLFSSEANRFLRWTQGCGSSISADWPSSIPSDASCKIAPFSRISLCCRRPLAGPFMKMAASSAKPIFARRNGKPRNRSMKSPMWRG